MTLSYETVKTPPQDDGIQKYLNFNLRLLSLMGMECSLNNDRPIKKSKFMQTLPVFMTNVISFTAMALQVNFITFVLREHSEENSTTQICSELFSNLLCISKVFISNFMMQRKLFMRILQYGGVKSLRLATAVDTIQTVFDEVSILWATCKPNRHCRVEVIEKAQQTLNFCKCYLGVIIGAVASFALPPIYNLVYHYFIREDKNYTLVYSKTIYLLRYPFEINNAPIFFSVLTEEGYLLFMCGTYWISCDTLFAQLTTHISIQFQILHYDIRALINHELVEDRLKANVIIFIKRHQNLLRVCRHIEDIFSPVIFATVLLSSLNICVNIFEAKTTSAEGNYTRTAMFIIMGVSLFFQILFYCIFAESLTNQTRAIADSVYNCKWTEKNHKLRFYLQMIIMESQNPFYCTAYGFFPIGHARMATILSTSFSYLMMLQSTS